MSLPYTKILLEDRIKTDGFEVGDWTYGEPAILTFGEATKLIIGRYCSIADNVKIFLGGNHRLDWVTTFPFSVDSNWPEAVGIEGHPRSRGDVRIGNDVWLGQGCTIMSGVTIGDGAVVGAGALVTRDIPPYAIVVGVPARIIRHRFAADVIARLRRVAWWDWPEEVLRPHLPLMLSHDIEAFLAAAEQTAMEIAKQRIAEAQAALTQARSCFAQLVSGTGAVAAFALLTVS